MYITALSKNLFVNDKTKKNSGQGHTQKQKYTFIMKQDGFTFSKAT